MSTVSEYSMPTVGFDVPDHPFETSVGAGVSRVLAQSSGESAEVRPEAETAAEALASEELEVVERIVLTPLEPVAIPRYPSWVITHDDGKSIVRQTLMTKENACKFRAAMAGSKE